MIPRDTSRAAYDAQIAYFRRMSPSERVERAGEMSDDVRAIASSGIRARHPTYSDDEVRLALFRVLLGDELFRRAWPDSPLLDA